MTFKPKSFTEAKTSFHPLKRGQIVRSANQGSQGAGNAANGGLKRSQRRLRAKPDANLQAWGRRIRARDGNQCRFPGLCMTGDNRIDPHHIAERSQRPDLKYVDSNGIALCRWHHDWVHSNPIQAIRRGLLSDRTMELATKEQTIGIR